MAAGAAQAAQIVQTTGDLHDGVGQALGSVAELILGDATDLYSSDSVFDAHPRPRQMAIVPFLSQRQRVLLGLFFGCRCSRTLGA
jgi:hypothetical protein